MLASLPIFIINTRFLQPHVHECCDFFIHIGVVAALFLPTTPRSGYSIRHTVTYLLPRTLVKGKLHFSLFIVFVIIMPSTHRAPKQWCLTKNETVTSFENWRQNLMYTLSLDKNFAPCLVADTWWERKQRPHHTEGSQTTTKTYRRQTAGSPRSKR